MIVHLIVAHTGHGQIPQLTNTRELGQSVLHIKSDETIREITQEAQTGRFPFALTTSFMIRKTITFLYSMLGELIGG